MFFARNNTESQCSFNPVSPNRNILQCGTLSQPGCWHWHSQDIGRYHYGRDFSCWPLKATSIFLSSPPPTELLAASNLCHFYYFVISKICKWNHAVCKILGLFFHLVFVSQLLDCSILNSFISNCQAIS